MAEMSNNLTNGDNNQPNENTEPLLVGSNISFGYDLTNDDSSLTYGEDQPLAVGNNLTVEITYAEAQKLEELGIDLDGSDSYLGDNIAVIGGGREWLDRADGNPLYVISFENDDYDWELADDTSVQVGDGSGFDASAFMTGEEPLLVGTNITFILTEEEPEEATAEGDSDASSSVVSNRDSQVPYALGSNLLLELPDSDGSQDNYLGSNLSTIGEDSQTSGMGGQTEGMAEDPLTGGMMPAETASPTTSDSGEFGEFGWDFASQDGATSSDSGGMGEGSSLDALYASSPWGDLSEVGVDSFEDVFPNVSNDANNPLAGGLGGGFGGEGMS